MAVRRQSYRAFSRLHCHLLVTLFAAVQPGPGAVEHRMVWAACADLGCHAVLGAVLKRQGRGPHSFLGALRLRSARRRLRRARAGPRGARRGAAAPGVRRPAPTLTRLLSRRRAAPGAARLPGGGGALPRARAGAGHQARRICLAGPGHAQLRHRARRAPQGARRPAAATCARSLGRERGPGVPSSAAHTVPAGVLPSTGSHAAPCQVLLSGTDAFESKQKQQQMQRRSEQQQQRHHHPRDRRVTLRIGCGPTPNPLNARSQRPRPRRRSSLRARSTRTGACWSAARATHLQPTASARCWPSRGTWAPRATYSRRCATACTLARRGAHAGLLPGGGAGDPAFEHPSKWLRAWRMLACCLAAARRRPSVETPPPSPQAASAGRAGAGAYSLTLPYNARAGAGGGGGGGGLAAPAGGGAQPGERVPGAGPAGAGHPAVHERAAQVRA